MCAIGGVWSDAPVDRRAFTALIDSMRARGPDGSGYRYEDEGRLALGHRRLAVLDPSDSGAQPMSDPSQRYWLTFNGEIFNFLELRRELADLGHAFLSDTDSEVILAAYAQYGEACLKRFVGMWSLGIWDRVDRSLFLAVDRFATKPLLYLETPATFAFASELKAFFHLPGYDARPADSMLRPGYLARANAGDAELEGVRRLLGGWSLRIGGGRSQRLVRWWKPWEHLVRPPASYSEQVEVFRHLFDDSCRLRLRSDVPLASSVSGGLDSTSVFMTLRGLAGASNQPVARRPADWQRGYFADAPGSDHSAKDRPFVELAFASAGIELRRLNLWEQPIHDDIERYLVLGDGLLPLTNYWSWALYRAMRRDGVVVVLDGNGADELLGGYPGYLIGALLNSGWEAVAHPARTLDHIDTLGHVVGRTSSRTRHRIRASRLILEGALPPGWRSGRTAWLGSLARQVPVQIDDPGEREHLAGLSALGRELYLSFWHRDLWRELRGFDLLSMNHGVETRLPFLDWRLVSFTQSLPTESLCRRGVTKRILRDAMGERLPAAVRERRDKVGFARPVDDLVRGPLAGWLRAEVERPSFKAYPELWDGRAIRDGLRRGDTQSADGLWRAVRSHWVLEDWARKARASVDPEPRAKPA